ncbi:hypothetical protein D3C72_2490380 [compost metagenome]
MIVEGPEMQIAELVSQAVLLHEIRQIHQPVRPNIRLDLGTAEEHKHIGRRSGDHFAFQLLLAVNGLV